MESVERPEESQIKYGACAYDAGYLQLETHTSGICNIYCSSTSTMDAI